MPTVICHEPEPGERVRFVSDLHLGHERCCLPAAELLPGLVSGCDTLVLNGDMAETRPCEWRERALALRARLLEQCERAGVRTILLAGNHDPDVPPMLLKLWGGSVAAMHGHALYREVAPWSWEYLRHKQECRALIAAHPEADDDLAARLELSRAMSMLHRPIMRRSSALPGPLRSLMHCFWPPERPWAIVRCWLRSAALANAFAEHYLPGVRTLVLGHFHRSGQWQFPRCRVYNTGAFFKHATPFFLDLQDGRVLHYAPVRSLFGGRRTEMWRK